MSNPPTVTAMSQNGALKKDDNGYPVMGGTSSANNSTVINSAFDPATRRLLTSSAVTTSGSATAQTSTNANVVQVTVGAADASYLVTASVLCTAFASGNLNVTIAYTDVAGNSITLPLNGHFTSGYGINVSGTGNFECQAVQVRAKAATTVTITTTGTFSLTYNIYGTITQLA